MRNIGSSTNQASPDDHYVSYQQQGTIQVHILLPGANSLERLSAC